MWACAASRSGRVRHLDQLAGGCVGIIELTRFDEFHGLAFLILMISTYQSLMERRAAPRKTVLISGAIE
jgi:hypothetical protein